MLQVGLSRKFIAHKQTIISAIQKLKRVFQLPKRQFGQKSMPSSNRVLQALLPSSGWVWPSIASSYAKRRLAIASPIPLAPPVITARRPSTFIDWNFSCSTSWT